MFNVNGESLYVGLLSPYAQLCEMNFKFEIFIKIEVFKKNGIFEIFRCLMKIVAMCACHFLKLVAYAR